MDVAIYLTSRRNHWAAEYDIRLEYLIRLPIFIWNHFVYISEMLRPQQIYASYVGVWRFEWCGGGDIEGCRECILLLELQNCITFRSKNVYK